MKFREYAEKLEKIKHLAENSNTGSPGKFASKIKVSERTLQRMVQQLRDHGYPITFNRIKNTYEVNAVKKNIK